MALAINYIMSTPTMDIRTSSKLKDLQDVLVFVYYMCVFIESDAYAQNYMNTQQFDNVN